VAVEAKADATAGDPPAQPAGTDAESSGLQDLVLKVLGAVGTGVGILGFVTFFGGAILWLRADEAEIPANDAVSVIPNSVLVTTGASFLVPAVLIAVLAVGVISLVHLGGYLPRRLRKRNAFEQAHRLQLKADRVRRKAEAKEALAKAARALATRLADAADQAKEDSTISPERKKAMADEAAAARLEAEEEEEEALALAAVAAERKAEAENVRASSESFLERPRSQFVVELIGGGLAVALLPLLLNRAIFHVGFWSGEVAILIGVALAAAVISLAAYVATDKFIWFGVVAFVTIGVYIGFATYFSTTGNPKVEPAAAVRSGHPPVIGTFIADTASNLYLGTVPEGSKPPHLLVIPRTQVVDLAIGPLVDPPHARERAIALAKELHPGGSPPGGFR